MAGCGRWRRGRRWALIGCVEREGGRHEPRLAAGASDARVLAARAGDHDGCQVRSRWRLPPAGNSSRLSRSSADGRRAAWAAWAAAGRSMSEARKRRRLSAVLDKLAERSVFSPPSSDSSDGPLDLSLPAHVCSSCGQGFAQRDRLAKHVASRHGRPTGDGRAYGCDVCGRCFARSDMLTRHMRLHTGLKPYTCRVCGQVFSRSDHLSTHQRTHTGEKPYKCPLCPYAACRRDMITRHMRTHARYEPPDSSGSSLDDDAGTCVCVNLRA
ncbi:hypothetical protein HPB50_011620 [Hyalomma asiaticum]|uniref:Uncharacterized protein n=1 Tax=Hyalomma asiaticum TaxID=266040 RepID=A0ACB7TG89_HYAAI|nr:hypothetical protein HPB50_011620 [Hyalomma asiaticum]